MDAVGLYLNFPDVASNTECDRSRSVEGLAGKKEKGEEKEEEKKGEKEIKKKSKEKEGKKESRRTSSA